MIKVIPDLCIGCGKCVAECFPAAIRLIDNKAIINNEGCIECGHCIAVCPVNAVAAEENKMSQVIEYNSRDFDINSDNLLNFIKYRRSIRQYSPQKIERDKILKIIEAGRFSPTGSNAQDVSYTVAMDNIDKLRELSYAGLQVMADKILDKSNVPSKQQKRYALMWKKMLRLFHKNPKNDLLFFNAPAVIIISSKVHINGALAASYMELMANSMGLGSLYSGFFGMASIGNPKVKDFLEIDPEKEIVTCMLIGYPNVKYKRTVPRKKAVIKWM